MSTCKNSYPPKFEHHYIMIEQRNTCSALGDHYYICKCCGHEKPLMNACVIDIEHQHDYSNYCGCLKGFHILKCTYFGCDSVLRIFNTDI